MTIDYDLLRGPIRHGFHLSDYARVSDYARANTNGAEHAPHATVEDNVEPNLGQIPAYPIDALPEAAQALVRYGERQGLPAALVGGAALAAIAAAIGKATEIEIMPSWRERPILWVPLIAPRGAGKTPSLSLAFDPLRRHDEQIADDDDARSILLGDQTLEALARDLGAVEGAAAIDLDELVVLLRGLGEYKRGAGGDRGRFLGLWSGGPWRFSRVGSKGGSKNSVRPRIPHPTVVICGGLQTVLHELLGGEEDGLRPRWLPHLAAMPDAAAVEPGHAGEDLQATAAWQALIERLIDNRDRPATRLLDQCALAVFYGHRLSWKREAAGKRETASTSAALVKADVQLARTALSLYEADPERPEQVEQDHIDRAAQIVNFTLDCWRALPEQGGLALTYRDQRLDRGIGRLMGWLEEHGGEATRRELQRAHVGGAQTAAELGALLARYEAVYPGTVTEARPPSGGLPTVVVKLPMRGRF